MKGKIRMFDLGFYLPQSAGEWTASLTALGVLVCGLWLVGCGVANQTEDGGSKAKIMLGSVYAGLGFSAIMMSQPLVYMALSIVFVIAIIGHILVVVSHRTINLTAVASIIAKLLVVILPLAYVFGFIN